MSSSVKYVATVDNGGYTWYLRRTTWTSEFERADQFDSKTDAEVAFAAVRKFMRKDLAKNVVILPAPDGVR